MNARVLLALPPEVQDALWRHLAPEHHTVEEAAFLYARRETLNGKDVFHYIEWGPVGPAGFASRSAYHLELTDEARAVAIKRAHDLDASLVEFHSHTGRWPAAFSGSDIAGFREFVPHVWWRLKGRPYLAVVLTRSGFDGFVWLTGPAEPDLLGGVLAGDRLLKPTNLSRWDKGGYD
jgi:proteasome lid subunit RPN8/RPN11